MSRKSAYKQVLSIGTAVVLGFALFTGSLDGAPKLLSPQSDEQAAALAEKQNESPSRTDDEADLVARLESGTASSSDSKGGQSTGDGSESTTTNTNGNVAEDSSATPIDEVENPDLNRARGVYLTSVPDYAGNPYVTLRADGTHPLGTPSFTLDEYERATEEGCFKKFSKLDSLGRTRKALACIGPESLGQGKRGDISRIHPAGWHQQRYDFIPGQSLYNRCHLIAWSLCGENANRKNLLTGTRYLNETGMLPFEEQILGYIRDTGNHVLYRVTPMYNEEELVCRGVRLEAQSVEVPRQDPLLPRILLQPAAARADRLRHRPQPGLGGLAPSHDKNRFAIPQGSKRAAPDHPERPLHRHAWRRQSPTLLGAALLIALDQLGLNVIGHLLVAGGLHGKVTRAARDRAQAR